MNKNNIYKIEYNDIIDFRLLLNDYINCFTRKKCFLHISDKSIKVAEIRFSKDHLPHILGLHKVINESANVFLTKILQGKLTHSSIKKHHNYQNIKDWLYSYNFLHRCFIEKIWHGV
ncbi:Uncharacterised protein [Staphylococcus piscifermentans]|uniref:Phage-Barnase-EndoU-ColicinE5/D-RelE like nuclease 4 domain-containing protein n=2 Tax=Staphylococcus piscifermentans TaxID=70258 RepID=A0A239U9M8_9STAP|nr:PBECR4 domain-containing protein [Staphylococcus piscifermentans]GEP84195.1 hypothetical protein SPI02_07800 [Staphylococcus piscifermentans]SNV05784.1 Uncharacterised protein [Staphylococcus piscifermentans]